ncbi:hypothetical protein T11_49 [Trichinella zimbabwensis]|uniref:Uncharacterized protein n=1 Tax=Trichinella zimbabwensis TaxID=268475 RepID=A0A0V1GDP5_9BILA|nr:hypothetical protein T11_49 [Trichinella zimbabwensis]
MERENRKEESYRQVGKIERVLVTANATWENEICV